MSGHLGPELAAFVDGELGDPARERVLRHLVGCADCRAEVEDARRFKSRLLGLGESAPGPAPDLAARLREVAAGQPTLPSEAARGRRVRPPDGRPPRGPAARRLPRRTVGGAVLVLGLGAVLALGGAPRPQDRVRLDPSSDAFLLDFASTSGELPLPEPAGVSPAGSAR